MKPSYVLLTISLILNVLLIGYLSNRPSQTEEAVMLANKRLEYPFLSPRIFIDNQNDLLINFIPLRTKLQQYNDNEQSRLGLYFEYLPTGTSIGINEKEAFVPASLLKAPLAMGVFKQYESGVLTPTQMLTITDNVKDPRFGTLWQNKSGTPISVGDTLNQLLIYSDNTAQELLLKAIRGSEIDDVFDALDIPKTRNEHLRPVVTAKNYSSILRCLYLSCYLTENHSNELLTMLTKTVFQDKLPGKIPKSIKIAHKIGVAEHEGKSINIYTDCGIVYVPKRPFILCAMVEATEPDATRIISDIGKIAYDYITNVNK